MSVPIKKQLIILAVLSTIVPMILLSILIYIYGNRMAIDKSKEINMDKILLIDQALTLYIEKTKHTINTIAHNSLVVGLNTNELVTYRHWSDWSEMRPYQNSKTEQNIYELLKIININNPDMGSVYIGTDSGKFVMYPPSNRRPFYNPARRPWYVDAEEKNGVITITRPFVSSDNNFHVFAVAKHIYFEKSKEFGVVSANIDLSSITGILSHFNLGKESYILLTTEDNTIIANTRDPLSVFKNLNADNLPNFYKELSKMNHSWKNINTDDNTYFVKKIQSLGTNWMLYALVDKKVVLAPFRKAFNALLICSLLIFAIFLPIIIKSLMYLLIPLKRLSDHIYSLANGDSEALQKKIPLYSPDEIGEIIENYNLLIESLNNIFLKILGAKQLISSNNSKISNQMLIISADITKNLSLIDSAEKKILETDVVLNDLLKDLAKVKNSKESKNKNISSADSKLEERLKKGKEDFDSCLKIITEYTANIKKSSAEMNTHVDKSVEYNKSILNESSNIGKTIYVYKLRSPENTSGDKENKKGKKED
ncbi:MAG: methyl-accepting chemotaxis protein [Spirochaetaceae bacterium]|nr:methyl-accepting chemotaxis protein [Spirochaetaceae bacterium]